jgi:hypothetical protein
MGKGKKIPKGPPVNLSKLVEQKRGRRRTREEDDYYSGEEEEQLEFRDIMKQLHKCDSWGEVLRVQEFFEDGLYEGHVDWLRELWMTDLRNLPPGSHGDPQEAPEKKN